jgi:hypothetical protein
MVRTREMTKTSWFWQAPSAFVADDVAFRASRVAGGVTPRCGWTTPAIQLPVIQML